MSRAALTRIPYKEDLMPRSNKSLWFGLACLGLPILAGGCAYVVYEASRGPLPAGCTIGVLVDLPWGGQSSNNDLSVFMTTALMRRGYHVKSINPADLIPQSIEERIQSANGKRYAFMDQFINMLGSNKAKINGSKEFWQDLMNLNEIKEAGLRFRDLNALVDDFIKRWNTDYILFITPSFEKGMLVPELMVRVIEIKNREVVFASYFKYNAFTFENNVSNPQVERSYTKAIEKDPNFKMIKMCELVASKLTSSRGAANESK
jgi:hypothetical protein